MAAALASHIPEVIEKKRKETRKFVSFCECLQGVNPTTDFRGCGLLALRSLLFFVQNFPSRTRAALDEQTETEASACRKCSFAITAINVAAWTLQWVLGRRDVARFFQTCVSKEAAENTFFQLFSFVMDRFTAFWTAASPPSILHFPFVAAAFQEQLRFPKDLFACELLHAEKEEGPACSASPPKCSLSECPSSKCVVCQGTASCCVTRRARVPCFVGDLQREATPQQLQVAETSEALGSSQSRLPCKEEQKCSSPSFGLRNATSGEEERRGQATSETPEETEPSVENCTSGETTQTLEFVLPLSSSSKFNAKLPTETFSVDVSDGEPSKLQEDSPSLHIQRQPSKNPAFSFSAAEVWRCVGGSTNSLSVSPPTQRTSSTEMSLKRKAKSGPSCDAADIFKQSLTASLVVCKPSRKNATSASSSSLAGGFCCCRTCSSRPIPPRSVDGASVSNCPSSPRVYRQRKLPGLSFKRRGEKAKCFSPLAAAVPKRC